MLHIAAGVCLGIVAAVYALNWLAGIPERREERRNRKAYRRMLREFALTDEQRELAATDSAIFKVLGIACLVLLLAYLIAPH